MVTPLKEKRSSSHSALSATLWVLMALAPCSKTHTAPIPQRRKDSPTPVPSRVSVTRPGLMLPSTSTWNPRLTMPPETLWPSLVSLTPRTEETLLLTSKRTPLTRNEFLIHHKTLFGFFFRFQTLSWHSIKLPVSTRRPPLEFVTVFDYKFICLNITTPPPLSFNYNFSHRY